MYRPTIASQGQDVFERVHGIIVDIRVASRQVFVENGQDDSDVIQVSHVLKDHAVLHRDGLIEN
jgi:hypothetical protein